MTPALTIHMTTYRRHRSGLLAQAVESVLAQNFTDFEFVICDDGSSDGTAAYLASVASTDDRVRVLRHPTNINSVAISLGHCLLASDPDRRWVSWMFDDCVLLPGALSTLVAAVADTSVEMVYGIGEVLHANGGTQRIGWQPAEAVRAGVADSSALVPNCGILVRRDVFDRVGWYDSHIVLRRSCDWELFWRIIAADTPFVVLPVVLAYEFGELQADSLRNSFTTTFPLMKAYVAARDASGIRMDLRSVLSQPVDWIPPADWSPEDLTLMQSMFIEYFLSVADVARAFNWARALAPSLQGRGELMRANLLQATYAPGSPERRAMAEGAYAATVLGHFRERGR